MNTTFGTTITNYEKTPNFTKHGKFTHVFIWLSVSNSFLLIAQEDGLNIIHMFVIIYFRGFHKIFIL